MPNEVSTTRLRQQLATGVLVPGDNQQTTQRDPSCLQVNDTQRRGNQDCRLPNHRRGNTRANRGSCLRLVDTNGTERRRH